MEEYMKKITIMAFAILCCALIISCGEGKGNPTDTVDYGKGVPGNWIWSIIDDEATNKWAPGISEINFELDEVEIDESTGEKLRVPATADMIEIDELDDDGNPIKAYKFKGTTKQKDGVTQFTFQDGAGWPFAGWMVRPKDKATQDMLRVKGFAYSFYIRVNNTNPTFTYQTSVDNSMYQKDEGHEPLFWFGSKKSKDETKGNSVTMETGEWKKITVVFDPAHPDYNMDYAKWLYNYGPNSGDDPTNMTFDCSKADSIKWQIQLQHNGGTEGAAGVQYSITSGSHDFDVDFYGLEMHLYD